MDKIEKSPASIALILTKIYSYVNQIKVYLAFRNIKGVWKTVNELTEYLVSIDVSEFTEDK